MALELTSPLWLLGLGLIPLVWWLHRFEGAGRIVTVGAVFPWPRGDSDGARHQRRRPPPVWWLRAGVVALLCVALAGPVRQASTPAPLVVWVDTSISMQTREGETTRLATAATDVVQAVTDGGYARVTLRTLSDPAHTLDLSPSTSVGEAAVASILRWAERAIGEPRAPIAALARSDAEHWLVTDGASRQVDAWLTDWPHTRVISVGSATDNASVHRVALRRSATDRPRHAGFVVVRNGSSRPAARELVIAADEQPLRAWSLALDAGETRRVEFDVDIPLPARIEARITPGDALAADDALTLDATPLAAVTWHATGGCPPALRSALLAHPGLAAVSTDGQFAVHCGPPTRTEDRPQLVIDVSDSASLAGPLVWSDRPDTLSDEVRVSRNTRAGRVLATVNGAPAVVLAPGAPRTLSIALDATLTSGAAFPADLLAHLVDRLLDRPVLDTVAIAQAAGEPDIAPRRWNDTPLTQRRVPASSRRVSLAATPVLLALLLLLADLWRVGRTASARTTLPASAAS